MLNKFGITDFSEYPLEELQLLFYKHLNTACESICPDKSLRPDSISECMLVICSKPEEMIRDIALHEKKIVSFVYVMVRRQWMRTTSPFWAKYRHPNKRPMGIVLPDDSDEKESFSHIVNKDVEIPEDEGYSEEALLVE